MDNHVLRKAIAYGAGVIVIIAWAIFHIIPYFIAMLCTTGILIYGLLIESAQCIVEEKFKEASNKKFCSITLLVLLILSVFIFIISI